VKALANVLTSHGAAIAALLVAGLAACQGVELGVGVKPAVPPPDPEVARQIEAARTEVAAAEQRTHEAARLAAEAPTSHAELATLGPGRPTHGHGTLTYTAARGAPRGRGVRRR